MDLQVVMHFSRPLTRVLKEFMPTRVLGRGFPEEGGAGSP